MEADKVQAGCSSRHLMRTRAWNERAKEDADPHSIVCGVTFEGGQLTDEMLVELMAAAAPKCILLMEDVDAVFNQRVRSDSDSRSLVRAI